MDPVRFDRWTRRLVAAPHARRRLLAALAGGLVAGSALGTPPTAQAKHHHKKACTGGATPCGKGCCAADDHCVNGTCYCAARDDGAAARATAACTPWPGCAAHRDLDAPCGAGVLGPCLCQRSLDATLACVTLDAPVCDCAHDADCRDGYVCVAGVEGCGGGAACVPTGDPFCLPGGPA